MARDFARKTGISWTTGSSSSSSSPVLLAPLPLALSLFSSLPLVPLAAMTMGSSAVPFTSLEGFIFTLFDLVGSRKYDDTFGCVRIKFAELMMIQVA